MADLRELIKKDETFKRYRNILKTVQGSLNIEKHLKEASWLHRGRKSRLLFEMRVSPQKLQEAILIDMSNRSRLVELKTLLLNEQELLSTAISLGKKHIRATYAVVLKEYGATKESHMLVVDKVFSAGIQVLNEIDKGVDVLDLLVKDIDQASFGMRNVTETLKMVLERKDGSV